MAYLHDMFKTRDANAWQREFPVGFPVEASALNSIVINIFHDVVAHKNADAWLKQNMSCWSVNSFDFALEKPHSHWSARAIFWRDVFARPLRSSSNGVELNQRAGIHYIIILLSS